MSNRPLVYILACVFSACVFAAGAEPNLPACEQAKKACDTVTIFITGNELGELRPCGCSGGQLGGFDRRSTVLKTVGAEQRVIIDTGNFLKAQEEQSLIKLDIMMQAFSMLDYDVVNLTKEDLINVGQMQDLTLQFITAQNTAEVNLPQTFSKQMQLGSKPFEIVVTAIDESSLNEAANKLEAAKNSASFRIVIFDGIQNEIEGQLEQLRTANVIIARSDSDEPGILKRADKGPMLISAGRLGKYVGRLDITAGQNGDSFNFSYRSIPITENIAQDPAFLDLYKSYQAIVKDQNLIETFGRFVLPNKLEYVGSSSCGLKGCHDYEYATAMTQKHAHAIESLVLVGSERDPECVICHVVGLEYKGGYVSEQQTPELSGVGCESCHGPGSRHIVTAGKEKTSGPKEKCLDCHTSEQSANYAGQQRQYCEKIFHWREPNALDCVQY